MRLLRGLLAACHLLPSVAVTAFVTAWALASGLSWPRAGLVALAVGVGQLSIGWANDWVDAGRDAAAGRDDKPIPRGDVPRQVVGAAAAVALVACVPASFALGAGAGAVHLIAVAAGWAYDLGLKATAASPLPYAVAFGLLPSVPTTATGGPGWPAPGVLAGGALLGVAAHFANTVADTEADLATGVRGLPQRLGPRRSLQVTAACLVAAAAALLTATLGASAGRGGLGVVLAVITLAAGAGCAGAVAVAGDRLGRRAFRLTLLAVALVIGGFLLSR